MTWNGGNGTYSQFDVLFNKNIYLAFNDISSCNRQGLDGGVIESCKSHLLALCRIMTVTAAIGSGRVRGKLRQQYLGVQRSSRQ